MTTSMAQLNGSVPGRMVVLGPERTFKLREAISPNDVTEVSSTDQRQSSKRMIERNDSTRSSRSLARSYSLSSYENIIANLNKSRWPRSYCFCLIGAIFCIGIGAAFGIYFGFQNSKLDKYVEYGYRGTFRVVRGDSYDSNLADLKNPHFATKARSYENRLNSIFKNSSIKDVYLHSEMITFEGTKGKDLLLYFNLYCWTKKTVNDAQVMEMILKEEFTGHSGESSDPKNSSSDSLQNIIVDFASIEVKARMIGSTSEIKANQVISIGDNVDKRFDDLPTKHKPKPNSNQASVVEKSNQTTTTRTTTPQPVPTSATSLSVPPGSSCKPVSLKFCQHLPYNFTTYPNLLGDREPRDTERLIEAAKLLVESECSPYIQHVLCHVLQPPCIEEEDGKTSEEFLLPPCRSVCLAVSASCKAKLGLSQQISRRQDFLGNKVAPRDIINGLRDLLRCDLFQMDDGLNQCTTNPVINKEVEDEPSDCVQAMDINGFSDRVCDGIMDCQDFSDEVDCEYCPEGTVHCGVGASCIEVERRCDGFPDCPNNSDERGCLTVAPDMDAANFVHQYFQDGYVILTEGNNTGKICVDSLNASTLSPKRQQHFIEAFGEAACRSMSYRRMDRIEVRTDIETSGTYAHLLEPTRWRTSFLRAPCRNRQVLHLSCSGLECGARPVHMHPDQPFSDLVSTLPSSHGDWPWLAALIRDGVHACDGTLVSEYWLLTSSACFDGQLKAHWVARFAAVRLTSEAPWEQERRIVGMVLSPVHQNNLVLVKLDSAVIYSDFVRPVCLAGDIQTFDSATSRCVFLAWANDDVADDLHEINAKVIDKDKCDNVTTVCADVSPSKDICRIVEFPGSPLLCQVTTGGAWSLAGVSNENRQCGTNNQKHVDRVYDGIIPIADWIVQTVRR